MADNIFTHLHERIYRYATSRLRLRKEAAEDLTQNVLSDIHKQNLDKSKPKDELTKIAIKITSRKHYRQAKKEGLWYLQDLHEMPDGQPSPEDQARWAQLRRQVGKFKEPQRTVLRHMLKGMTIKESARELELNEKTVDSHRRRAIKRLKEVMTGSRPWWKQ